MKDSTCMYCTENEKLQGIMLYICDLKASKLYLHREQSYPGRCILAFQGHKRELFDLTEQELKDFTTDIATAAKAISKAFGPHKINYGAFGDKVDHLHFHLVPKYEGGKDFGGMFEMMVTDNPVTLSPEEYSRMMAKIKENL